MARHRSLTTKFEIVQTATRMVWETFQLQALKLKFFPNKKQLVDREIGRLIVL